MLDLNFRSLDPEATRAVLAELSFDLTAACLWFPTKNAVASVTQVTELVSTVPLANLSPETATVQVATLPFYEAFTFYALSDRALLSPNTYYLLHKSSGSSTDGARYQPGEIVLLDWTNEPIYNLNCRAPIKLDRQSIVPYVKFFLHYVRGRLGSFSIVERIDDIAWQPTATDRDKACIAEKLMPATYQGVGPDQLLTVSATVVFRNALFRTDIKVAPRAMEVIDPDLGIPEYFTIGQLKLTNEELLAEDLSVELVSLHEEMN